MSNEKMTVLLAPVGVPLRSVLPDATQIRADCGHQAWIGPESLRVIEESPGTKTICMLCLPRDLTGQGFVAPRPEELAKAAAHIGTSVEVLRHQNRMAVRSRGGHLIEEE